MKPTAALTAGWALKSKMKNYGRTKLKACSLLAGLLGLSLWIALSYGDAESEPEPIIGWRPLDNWMMESGWMFLLVPICCFVVPAVVVYLLGRRLGGRS